MPSLARRLFADQITGGMKRLGVVLLVTLLAVAWASKREGVLRVDS